jgi:hypothetical protein
MLRKVGLEMQQFLLLGGYSPQPFSERFCSKHNHFVLENGNLMLPLCCVLTNYEQSTCIPVLSLCPCGELLFHD